MLTCKQFLEELNDYLDPSIDPEMKRRLEAHVCECPNCFVIVDTTMKTLKVFRGMDPQPISDDLRNKLWSALERKMAAKKGIS